MKRFVIGIAAMAVLVCAAYLVYGIFSFLALTQIRDVEFPAPNERQIAYVAEIAGMDAAALNIRQAERIVVSVSSHQSDSQIAFVYQSDGSALLDGAFPLRNRTNCTSDQALNLTAWRRNCFLLSCACTNAKTAGGSSPSATFPAPQPTSWPRSEPIDAPFTEYNT